jgi:hypothetical protein
MERQIPLFPLSIVTFPGEEVRLHIFEPRYRQLVHDCIQENKSFGIPPYIEGKSLKYGTELLVKEIVKTYEDGKMDIKAQATGWFEIIDFYRIFPGKLYPGGTINEMPWDDDGDIVRSTILCDLIMELYEIMKITNVPIPDPKDFKSWMIIHKLGLNIEQEMELLIISEESEKQGYLIRHLEALIPVVREAENLRKRAELNGHFQNLKPPSF